jgi:hypothetical protein
MITVSAIVKGILMIAVGILALLSKQPFLSETVSSIVVFLAGALSIVVGGVVVLGDKPVAQAVAKALSLSK